MTQAPIEARPESLLAYGGTKKLPVILQTEAAECGLACLAMIAGYFGYNTDLTTLRHKFSVSAHGSTLNQVMDTASKMHMSSRALKLDLDHLAQLQTPCILHWEMKHFVVLKKVAANKVVIHDPSVGERVFTIEEVSKLFTGVALELTPTPEFEKKEEKQVLTLGHFWSRISGLKRSLVVVLILSLLLQVIAIVNPYYMQTVVDDVILKSDLNLLTVLALGFGLLLLIDTGTTVLRQYVILNLSSKLNIQMASNVFHHLIRLPMDYFAKRHMGDVVSRFGSLATIRELLTTGLVAVVIDGLMALITLVVMFFYDIKLTFIVIGVVVLYALLRFALYRPLRLLTEESIVTSAKENSHFMESVRAIQTIKLFERESDRQNQWQNKLADSMNKDIQISRWNIGFNTANKLLFGIENIIVIYFAAIAVTESLLSVGMLYAFINYKTRFITSMDNLIGKWIEFRMLELHFARLADIVFTKTDSLMGQSQDIQSFSDSQNPDQHISGKLEGRNLAFAYSEIDAPVFEKLNFTIEAGETVAIIGPSGGGKSTLLKCMMGLMTPTDGSLLVDDKPVQQINRYRSQIAGVLQDDQLLSGSIAENIACFSSTMDIERVVLCAHLACIHDEVMQMAMQYNTLVGDMGNSLSGGQKQRIVMARALYRQPKILFMDEATSHLDTKNEAAINQHIKELAVTRIIVAHRPETIMSAERILKLDNGCLSDVTAELKTTK
ncbi:MAG: ATP-binding cassette subfamily B protein RaxB [Oleiphilaceae bacterium]|jgi:ATP-binding cassette subfamily B protein RaxB